MCGGGSEANVAQKVQAPLDIEGEPLNTAYCLAQRQADDDATYGFWNIMAKLEDDPSDSSEEGTNECETLVSGFSGDSECNCMLNAGERKYQMH